MSTKPTAAFIAPMSMCASKSSATSKNELNESVVCQITPAPNAQSHTRRAALQYMAAALSAGILLPSTPAHAGTNATGRTIVNGILSGYGLPTLRDVSGFTPILAQYGALVVRFQYPSAWVVSRNVAPVADSSGLTQANGRMSMGAADAPVEGRSSGLTAGDYRKAEGLSFYVSRVPQGVKDVKDLSSSFIADLVTPGDATGSLPNAKVVADRVDEDGYRLIDTKYESITVSGYSVERRGRTRATVLSDGKLYALTAGCSDIRWKKVVDILDTSLGSFQVFRV